MTEVRTVPGWQLRAPQIPWFALDRPALRQRLSSAFDRSLVAVIAPAGFGKSVALAQWAAVHTDRRVAWLRVDAADADGARFGRHVLAALQQVAGPDTREALGELAHLVEPGGRALGVRFTTALLDVAERMPPTVLVLDDADRPDNPQLLRGLDDLVQHLPEQLHVVMATRADPDLDLHRLRARDELTEIRAADLVFSVDEVAELITKLARVGLTEEQVESVLARTGGWPIGVQQVALALRENGDAHDFTTALAGDHRQLTDYLTTEIVDRQSPHLQEFLRSTALLDDFSGELCDAVLERTDSARLIDALERRAMFVTRLDEGWFRYAGLFRDLLRAHVRSADSTLEPRLLVRAANVHLANGDHIAAGRYLVRARAWDDLSALVLRAAFPLRERGEVATPLGWIAALPPDHAAALEIRLAEGYLLEAAGDHFRAAEVLSQVAFDDSVDEGFRTVAHAFRSLEVHAVIDPRSARSSAAWALDRLDRIDPPDVMGITAPDALHLICRMSTAWCDMFLGDLEAARMTLHELLPSSQRTHLSLQMQLLGSVALAEAWSGRTSTAEQWARVALRQAKERGLGRHPGRAKAHLALAHVALLRNDLDAAAGLLDVGEELARVDRRYAFVWSAVLDRAYLLAARGRPAAALELLSNHVAAGAPQPPPLLEARALAVRAGCLASMGDLAAGRRLLAKPVDEPTSELRLMQLRLAAAAGDWSGVGALLDRWDPDGSVLRELGLGVWRGVMLLVDGAVSHAVDVALPALDAAREHTLVRPLVDGGPEVTRLVRHAAHRVPSSFLQSVLEAPTAMPIPVTAARLAEPLSDRELAVLRYLPGRLRNDEIASALYISLNTLKTHLKSIYRKLGVGSRREAVQRAEDQGLL